MKDAFTIGAPIIVVHVFSEMFVKLRILSGREENILYHNLYKYWGL